MKKLFLMLLACVMLAGMTSACAEDLGIQIIGGEVSTKEAEEALSPDDLQLNAVYVLDDCAIVSPRAFQFADCFAQFNKGETAGKYSIEYLRDSGGWYVFSYANSSCIGYAMRYTNAGWIDSGDGAQFIWLRMDVTNANAEVENLSDEIAVKVVYRDSFEFGGWIRQINYNMISKNSSDGNVTRYNTPQGQYPMQVVVHPEDAPVTGFMQTGYYIMGCTVPNYVVEDTEAPLRIEVSIGDEVVTYHIRKLPN